MDKGFITPSGESINVKTTASQVVKTDGESVQDFFDNGGSIGGSVIAPSLKTKNTSGWSGVYMSSKIGDTTSRQCILTANPVLDQLHFQADWGGANADLMILCPNSLYPLGTSKSLGEQTVPWSDLWLGNRSVAQVGYTKLPNGMLLQWGDGICWVPKGSFVEHEVTFPVKFPVRCVQFYATAYYNATSKNASGAWGVQIRPLGINVAQSVTCYSVDTQLENFPLSSANEGGTNGINFHWMAIGY